MKRWIVAIWMLVLCCAVVSSARAASVHFSLPVQMDGRSIGTVSGTLKSAPAPGGKTAWALNDGTFTPATTDAGTIVWDGKTLYAAGQSDDGAVILREFEVTIQQPTGMDVTYRFRISATLKTGQASGITVAQAS